MTMPTRLAAAAVIGVLAVGGTLFLIQPGQHGGRRSEPDARCERPARASPPPTPDPDARLPKPAQWP